MEKIVVQKSMNLEGSIRVSGAKNASLPIIAASLLGTEDIFLEDVPDLEDVKIICDVLKSLGAEVERIGTNELRINSSNINKYETDTALMNKMRASFLVMGPLLGRMGKAKNGLPGGCSIGARPIDLHLKGFKALGVEIEENIGESDDDSFIFVQTDKLVGGKVYLDFPSVGATENIMMAAVLAEGRTIIENAAMEPEIVDLSNFLRKLGADVKGAGTNTITIDGVEKLGGARHQIIPDRIEAATYMAAAAITSGNILIENVIPSHLRPVIAKLEEAGCKIIEEDEALRVIGPKELKSIDIKTLPYPGFPTDAQAQFMIMMTQAKGTSLVQETVFENRFMHAEEFNKMGAEIRTDGNSAVVDGPSKLYGTEVRATDLRCGAALVLAGFVAEGDTEIYNIGHIDRGYENIEEKFSSVGGRLKRVPIEE